MSRHIVLICLVAVSIHFFCNILALVHFETYSNDGVGLPSVWTFVTFMEQAPEIIVITLSFLIAKGLFISAEEIQSTRGIAEIVIVYTALVVAMLNQSAQAITNGVDENYYLETDFGVVLLVARFIVLISFLSTLYGTCVREKLEVKIRFYKMYAVFASLFFCTMPIAYIIAATVYDYHRKKTDYICQQSFDILGYICLFLFFGTGKGGFVKTQEENSGGHQAVKNQDEDETQC